MDFDALIASIKSRSEKHPLSVVALSGGVDSGLVAAAAHAALGERALAVTVLSELTPIRDRKRAESIARHVGIAHRILRVSVLFDEDVRMNGPRRCYHCKKQIFQAIINEYGQDCLLMDGTNGDDDRSRPGLLAANELGVYSPLDEAGFAKSSVREVARNQGLPNWDTPSESCLATRIQTGTELTAQGLKQVETLETFFHDLGVETLRVRHDNLVAIVEYLPQFSEIVEKNRDKFVALTRRIGLRSCEFKEWRE